MMSMADNLYAQARECLRLRNEADAMHLVEQALAIQADHGPSLHLGGLLAGRAGRDGQAVDMLQRALAVGHGEVSSLLLAAIHERAGRGSEAEQLYRQLLAISPASVEALLRLGLLLTRQGLGEAALPFLRHAILCAPDDAGAHGALASALHGLGMVEAALPHALRAVELAPGNRDFIGNLAVIHNALGDFAEAEALCRAALTQGEDAGLCNTLGIALKMQDRIDEAGDAFERALAMVPGFNDALYNLAGVRKDQARTPEAISLLQALIDRAPDLAAARFALCMAHLPPFHEDEAQIDRNRAAYEQALGELEAYADEVGPAALAPGVGAAQPFYLAYHGHNDVALQRRYGRLVCRVMAAAFPATPLAEPVRAGERLRVGIVCGHIRSHSVWQIPTRGWVEGLDRARFDLFAYHTSAECDAETTRARALFEHFTQGPRSTEDWRETIARDRPHVLIYPEIGMDPMVARLAAMRLAPRQYASWGHPVTSGYPTIDAFLSSDAMEPEDGDLRYAERLVRLPGLSSPFAPPALPPATTDRTALGLPEDAVIYWSGQSLTNIGRAMTMPSPPSPCACLGPASSSPPFRAVRPSLSFRERLAVAFRAKGLNAEDHCIILPRMAPHDYRAAMGCADIMLDSLGWSGCNSLIEALAWGLPVVTLPGDTMPSATARRSCGISAWITPSPAAARPMWTWQLGWGWIAGWVRPCLWHHQMRWRCWRTGKLSVNWRPFSCSHDAEWTAVFSVPLHDREWRLCQRLSSSCSSAHRRSRAYGRVIGSRLAPNRTPDRDFPSRTRSEACLHSDPHGHRFKPSGHTLPPRPAAWFSHHSPNEGQNDARHSCAYADRSHTRTEESLYQGHRRGHRRHSGCAGGCRQDHPDRSGARTLGYRLTRHGRDQGGHETGRLIRPPLKSNLSDRNAQRGTDP
jgi:predicted O-linked N-acetylglucosamine transferase (SPINDLY family)